MASKEEIESKIYQLVGYEFNISSNKQLIKALYEDMALPVIEKTSAGNPSTTEGTLKKLAADHQIAQLVIDYRLATKKVISKNDEEQKKAPKPGMPQPRQVLTRANVIDELNLAPEEIIKAEEKKEGAKQKATVVSVAKDITDNDETLSDVQTNNTTEDKQLKDKNTDNQTNEEDTQIVSEKNEDKTVELSSNSSLSGSSYSIIKKSDKEKTEPKKKFNIDDNTDPENEFSKNSVVLNVKNKENSDINKSKKSRASLYIIGLVVLLFAICIFIYMNSLNSI